MASRRDSPTAQRRPERARPCRRTGALAESRVRRIGSAASNIPRKRCTMAIGVYFSPESFPVGDYDSTLKAREGAGAGAPAGRLYHCAMESPGGVHVFDVWESQEAFEAFGATLLPILSAAGVDPGQPMIAEIHKVIRG